MCTPAGRRDCVRKVRRHDGRRGERGEVPVKKSYKKTTKKDFVGTSRKESEEEKIRTRLVRRKH